MQAEEYLSCGDVAGALSDLQERVRKHPAKVEYRIFLFQLLAVLGQWGRANNQLDVLAELDAGTLAMVQTYREGLRCEVLRGEVFAGQRSPLVFGDPEEWMAQLIQALGLAANGRWQEADALREAAFEQAPTTTGTIDGQPFQWIADADARIGPFLEAVVNGQYYWVPFNRLRRVQFEAPEDLRDMVWTPAHLTWANGGEAMGLIPTRYPGSEESDNSQLQLARLTEWRGVSEESFMGLGQRLLATDAGDYALLDIRDIQLDVASEPDTDAEPAVD